MSETDEPDYPLDELAVRHGYTPAMLRTERRKGRLQVANIAGKLRATDSAIREMRRLCLEEQKALACTSDQPERTEPLSGSSSTEERKQALDAARATLKAQNERLRPTSPTKSTSKRGPPKLRVLTSSLATQSRS
jgi:hypothetical protein